MKLLKKIRQKKNFLFFLISTLNYHLSHNYVAQKNQNNSLNSQPLHNKLLLNFNELTVFNHLILNALNRYGDSINLASYETGIDYLWHAEIATGIPKTERFNPIKFPIEQLLSNPIKSTEFLTYYIKYKQAAILS